MKQFGFLQRNNSTKKGLAPRYIKQNRTTTQNVITTIYLSGVFVAGVFAILFISGRLVVGGVPSSIIMRFLQDDIARSAYFRGDKAGLHDRLDDMGIEAEMKTFYRPQIPDEAELDQHIHQILYDRTGYVGVAYTVNSAGVLVLKDD
ncbi:hypothetical protein H6G89_19795 [Oscillatoria sp. FACHB-1407]|uniref:hypothetical protein n=1 Tax=Oscillatoria sp. FACHB-1407 TaxID=2692847 RepID=UPI0016896FB0|nr:hypothetical protein [Oscillatoria sp. FACHB-1407]MBD2463282.1 hypothetical protein [Oscillatoria sp. FACHB-1407]